ncbi:hypothetical protein [Parasitella parasitica]|uniref:Tc1-like transposase DDE domain-containing protein n=1 Tax=Parasitella parasitica TaxID=35722 RepID=A0A0B7NQ81_9FUNG|nr:hypothetical protein [Parasitella parasitica]
MNEEYNFDSETVPVMILSYMEWEETAAVNTAQKEAKRKTKPHFKKPFLNVVKKERGSYITKNEAKVVNLIDLLQEFKNMSISEAGRKVGLSKSTAIGKVKQWNQMTSEIDKKGFPDSITSKKESGDPQYSKTIILSVENHMKKKCRLTYKRIIPRYYGRNTDETVAKRRDAVAYWVRQNIDFMNECVFLDEAGFNNSMHRSYGWPEAGIPCKIDFQTKGANVSILGAICKSGLIT